MPNQGDYTAWASAACDYARSIIDECATEINISKEVIWERYHKVNRVRFNLFGYQESLYRLFGIPNDILYLWFKRSVKNTKEIRAGNCSEYARLAFNHLRKIITTGIRIEILLVTEGDHAFVVIGRSKTLEEFAQGKDDEAVICDPYRDIQADRVYPATEIKQRLRCFRDYVNEGEPWPFKNEEYSFNSNVHHLRVDMQLKASVNHKKNLNNIKAAQKRVNIITEYIEQYLKNLSNGHEEVKHVYAQLKQAQQDISLYQSADQKKPQHGIAVERYLNKKIKQATVLLTHVACFIPPQLFAALLTEILLTETDDKNKQQVLAQALFSYTIHISNEVLMLIFNVFQDKNLFKTVAGIKYLDASYDEKDLSLLTLVLRRRDSKVFTHLLKLLPDELIYKNLVVDALPFDRFFKWLELSPESREVMVIVLQRLQELVNPEDVMKICSISTDYECAVRENDVLAHKFLFANKLSR